MANPRRALVFIVESPRSYDFVYGHSEGRLLSESLRLDVINQRYFLATSIEVFRQLLKFFKTVVLDDGGKAVPILHISAHACQDGIGFTNGRLMKWGTLARILVDLNQASKGKLVVCLSCCMGSYINFELVRGLVGMPFKAAVSAYGSPKWNDAAIAFVVFYHHYINKNTRIGEAVRIMNEASKADHTSFGLDYARGTQGRLISFFHREFKKWKPPTPDGDAPK